jgi:hypothetical protein
VDAHVPQRAGVVRLNRRRNRRAGGNAMKYGKPGRRLSGFSLCGQKILPQPSVTCIYRAPTFRHAKVTNPTNKYGK